MYRKPDEPPVGAWATFLHRQRQERNWSQQRAFEELREGLGLGPKSRASYRAIDMGERQPRPDEERFLRAYFEGGPTAEDEAPPAVETPELATAISDLVVELRESRTKREETEARLRALEAEVQSLRDRLGAAASSGRSAPLTSAG